MGRILGALVANTVDVEWAPADTKRLTVNVIHRGVSPETGTEDTKETGTEETEETGTEETEETGSHRETE